MICPTINYRKVQPSTMTCKIDISGFCKNPHETKYLTPEPAGTVKTENVPDPKTVIALIGQEQRLINLWVESGTRALAEILEVPEKVLGKRWNCIKAHPGFQGMHISFKERNDYPQRLWETVEGLSKFTRHQHHEISHSESYSVVMMPRPDLGWVSLTEYAQVSDEHMRAALAVIDNHYAYKYPPRRTLDPKIPEYRQVHPGAVFGRYTGKTLRIGRKWREDHKHLLAYPRVSSRTHRVLWDKPETRDGETYYPVEAAIPFTLSFVGKDWEVKAGDRGGYVKNYDCLDWGWVTESVYVAGKVCEGSLVTGDAYIGENVTIKENTRISGKAHLNRRMTIRSSKITGNITIGTEGSTQGEELIINSLTMDGEVTIDDAVKGIGYAEITGDIDLKGDLTVFNTELTGSMVINSTGGYELCDSLKGELDHKGNKPIFELRNAPDRRQYRSMGYYQQKPSVD
jgi:hypothetical protein